MTEPLLFELGSPSRPSPRLPAPGVKAGPIDELVPAELRRRSPLAIPSVSEPDLARHFGRLGRLNFNLHQGLYPLGSCTMKYNPAVNEALARLDDFADLHPYHPPARAQGALRLMWELERALLVLTAMDRLSLQPAAGAHGEWTGLRIIQAYHRSRGESRDEVLVPDSAHGTNPASATLSHLKTIAIKSGADGLVNLDDFKNKLSKNVAAVMLTNPNTLGLFEKDILEITRLAHEQGVQMYYDGANLNALVGIARPGDMGFDVVHLNLHKTFSTPHGGGGPGAGPVGVKSHLVPFLPVPTVERSDEGFRFDYDRPQTIGKVRTFYGNFGMLVRAYAYIRTYGNTINEVAENAVLNSSYLRHHLRKWFDDAFSGPSMHEFVLTAKKAKAQGVTAKDIAKRLIDLGFHPPTIYFPLIVPEALMIEPTETESRATLDAFIAAMGQIVEEIATDPEVVKTAPNDAPVGRLDEVRAARQLDLRWRPKAVESAPVAAS
ncbi:MAG TPA: aminomethyl-transferring glycine dehydrogenase subunit GcvPB [Candidatus Angelobacter sp.]|nr:aminomethyl-transferring glycine dehydrogenase subunit GcvPB [Candidatus Angelobacter sp.]